MKTWFNKYFKTDYLIAGAIILLILFLAIGGFYRVQTQNELQGLIEEIGGVYSEAQQLALRAEKFQGQDIYSYGVYFDEDLASLIICADLNGDLACDFNERYREALKIETNKFSLTEIVPVNFLRFKKIKGVCYTEMCDLSGDQAIMKIATSGVPHYAEVAVNAETGKFLSHIYE